MTSDGSGRRKEVEEEDEEDEEEEEDEEGGGGGGHVDSSIDPRVEDPRSSDLGSEILGDLESTTARGFWILDPRIHRGSNLDDGLDEEENLEEEPRSSIDPRVEGSRSSDLGSEILGSRIHDGPRILEPQSEDRSKIEA